MHAGGEPDVVEVRMRQHERRDRAQRAAEEPLERVSSTR
jgi:hypothetical protein